MDTCTAAKSPVTPPQQLPEKTSHASKLLPCTRRASAGKVIGVGVHR